MIWILTAVQLFAVEHLALISVSTDFLKDGDTVTVTVFPYAGRLAYFKSSFTVPAKGNCFTLEIPVYDKPQFILIRFNKPEKPDIGPLILFPGDDLQVSIQTGKINFNGQSAQRFYVQQQLEAVSAGFRNQFRIIYAPDALAMSFARIDSCAAICLRLLERRKGDIGESAFTLLRNDRIAEAITTKLGYVTYACLHKAEQVQHDYIAAFRKYAKPFNGYPTFVAVDSSDKPTSKFAVELIYQQYLVDSCILARRKFNLHDCYVYESRNFKGEMRQQLLTELFMLKRNSPELSLTDIDGALGYVSNPGFRKVLEKMRELNTVGGMAPEFILRDDNNKEVKLSDLRGKLVVLDFWFTGCGACKALAPALYTLEKKYAGHPVVFLSVSIDKSREHWLATLKTNQYTSPLAVKLYTEGRGDQHPVIRDFDVHGYPTIIILDRKGRFCPKPELNEQGLSEMIDRFL